MSTFPITPNEVISAGTVPVQQAMDRLRNDSTVAHERGYHAYSACLSNLAYNLEQAMLKFVDAVEEVNA